MLVKILGDAFFCLHSLQGWEVDEVVVLGDGCEDTLVNETAEFLVNTDVLPFPDSNVLVPSAGMFEGKEHVLVDTLTPDKKIQGIGCRVNLQYL